MMFMTPVGEAVEVSPRRRRGCDDRLSPDQIRARRNEDWRLDHEVGRVDPESGRPRPRPIWLIAALSGVSERTVQLGIAEGRRLHEEVTRAIASN